MRHRCVKCGKPTSVVGGPKPPCVDCGGDLCEVCCDAVKASKVRFRNRGVKGEEGLSFGPAEEAEFGEGDVVVPGKEGGGVGNGGFDELGRERNRDCGRDAVSGDSVVRVLGVDGLLGVLSVPVSELEMAGLGEVVRRELGEDCFLVFRRLCFELGNLRERVRRGE